MLGSLWEESKRSTRSILSPLKVFVTGRKQSKQATEVPYAGPENTDWNSVNYKRAGCNYNRIPQNMIVMLTVLVFTQTGKSWNALDRWWGPWRGLLWSLKMLVFMQSISWVCCCFLKLIKYCWGETTISGLHTLKFVYVMKHTWLENVTISKTCNKFSPTAPLLPITFHCAL